MQCTNTEKTRFCVSCLKSLNDGFASMFWRKPVKSIRCSIKHSFDWHENSRPQMSSEFVRRELFSVWIWWMLIQHIQQKNSIAWELRAFLDSIETNLRIVKGNYLNSVNSLFGWQSISGILGSLVFYVARAILFDDFRYLTFYYCRHATTDSTCSRLSSSAVSRACCSSRRGKALIETESNQRSNFILAFGSQSRRDRFVCSPCIDDHLSAVISSSIECCLMVSVV
jgi:hypothetical protein